MTQQNTVNSLRLIPVKNFSVRFRNTLMSPKGTLNVVVTYMIKVVCFFKELYIFELKQRLIRPTILKVFFKTKALIARLKKKFDCNFHSVYEDDKKCVIENSIIIIVILSVIFAAIYVIAAFL